jgi:TolB-like protein/tetratricopeptide (TPR) repeat protein
MTAPSNDRQEIVSVPALGTSSSERGFWSRFKEHKLIQTTLAYLVAALAIAHGEELVASAYHWPELVGRIVIGSLGLGLPLALVIVLIATRKVSAADRAAAGRTLDRIFLLVLGLIVVGLVAERLWHTKLIAPTQLGRLLDLALGLLVVALLGDRLWSGRRGRPDSAPASTGAAFTLQQELHPTSASTQIDVRSPAPSIAVLPFANLSSDPEQEYFSDGLAEELIDHLAHIKGLRVLGRTSSFAFKGKNEDLRVIGEKLSVGCVLEGSVRKAGNRLRITAQLVGCTDGYHLWSESFDRELTDVFAIQNDISRSVAHALGIALGVSNAMPLGGTRNLEAYDLYLRAQALQRLFGLADLERAGELYRQALALDPDFALAWTGLAVLSLFRLIYSPGTSAQAREEFDRAVERALAIAPNLWATQGVHGTHEAVRKNWDAAERAYRKGLELAPPSEGRPSISLALMLAGVGRTGEAISLLRFVLTAEPLSILASQQLQSILTVGGRYEEADVEYRRSLDLPGNREGSEHAALIRAWVRGMPAAQIKEQMRRFLAHGVVNMPVQTELLELLDQPATARARLRQAYDDVAYQDSTRQFKIALWAAQFDDIDLALAAARRAFIDLRGTLIYVLWLPTFRNARKDPRFKELLRDLRIVEYWREGKNWGDFARPLGADDFEVW